MRAICPSVRYVLAGGLPVAGSSDPSEKNDILRSVSFAWFPPRGRLFVLPRCSRVITGCHTTCKHLVPFLGAKGDTGGPIAGVLSVNRRMPQI